MRVWLACLLVGLALAGARKQVHARQGHKQKSVKLPIQVHQLHSLEPSETEESRDSKEAIPSSEKGVIVTDGTVANDPVTVVDDDGEGNRGSESDANDDVSEQTVSSPLKKAKTAVDQPQITNPNKQPIEEPKLVEDASGPLEITKPSKKPTEEPKLVGDVPGPLEKPNVPTQPKEVLTNKPKAVAEKSDEEAEMTSMAYQDMTNLYHAHDSASLTPIQRTLAPPHPFLQGMVSSMWAYQRVRTCSPQLFKVNEAPRAESSAKFRWNALTANDVLQHVLGTLSMIQMGKVPETPFSNVDGRVSHPVLGAMGGDAGEFILALNAFEKVSGQQFDALQVATLLSDFLIYVNKPSFAFQTDDEALVKICKKTGVCLHQGIALDNPPASKFDDLRQVLIKPAYNGCAHIRHMLEVTNFEVRRELVESFILAFFNLLWGVPQNSLAPMTLRYVRAKLSLQVLQGPHTEGAILRVNTIGCGDYFPMLIPEASGVSVAIMHDDAVNALRSASAAFLAEEARKMGYEEGAVTDEERIATEMRRMGDAMYAKALVIDNGRTPVFTLNFPAACCGGV